MAPSVVHEFVELCIAALGHVAIAEAGPVRAIKFDSQQNKEVFRSEFTQRYDDAVRELPSLGGMNPFDFWRMRCRPREITCVDDQDKHSVVFLVDIDSELAKTLWQDHVRGESAWPLVDLAQFQEVGHAMKLRIIVGKAKARDRYAARLADLQSAFGIVEDRGER